VPFRRATGYRRHMSSDVVSDQLSATVVARPRFRGHLHTWTAAIAIPAGVLLIVVARSASARVGASIYAASVLPLFGTSASYHRLAYSVRARQILRRLDHSMIFVS